MMSLVLLIFLSINFYPRSEFVKIVGGKFIVGEKGNEINPKRKIILRSFEISKTELTNAQFLKFVEATNYRTTAEEFKNAMTFEIGLDEYEWLEDSTANWRFPFGVKKGGIENKMNHPVTCISFIDVQTYCKWKGERLPTLMEWEVASKGGSSGKFFFGIDEGLIAEYANIWTNKTHKEVPIFEEHYFTSPVASFKPNQFGLYDMYGNVFEFCSDKFSQIEDNENLVCTRGGSWWCSENSCGYYNSFDIGRIIKYASFSNVGFRTVKIVVK